MNIDSRLDWVFLEVGNELREVISRRRVTIFGNKTELGIGSFLDFEVSFRRINLCISLCPAGYKIILTDKIWDIGFL